MDLSFQAKSLVCCCLVWAERVFSHEVSEELDFLFQAVTQLDPLVVLYSTFKRITYSREIPGTPNNGTPLC